MSYKISHVANLVKCEGSLLLISLFINLYNVFKEYFSAEKKPELESKWLSDYDALTSDFAFISDDFTELRDVLLSVNTERVISPIVENAILKR